MTQASIKWKGSHSNKVNSLAVSIVALNNNAISSLFLDSHLIFQQWRIYEMSNHFWWIHPLHSPHYNKSFGFIKQLSEYSSTDFPNLPDELGSSPQKCTFWIEGVFLRCPKCSWVFRFGALLCNLWKHKLGTEIPNVLQWQHSVQ